MIYALLLLLPLYFHISNKAKNNRIENNISYQHKREDDDILYIVAYISFILQTEQLNHNKNLYCKYLASNQTKQNQHKQFVCGAKEENTETEKCETTYCTEWIIFDHKTNMRC